MATDLDQPDIEAESADAAPDDSAATDSGGEGRVAALLSQVKAKVSPKHLKLAGIVLGVLALIVVLGVLQSGDQGPTNAELLAEGLRRLDNGENAEAASIAREILQRNYQDPQFPGGDQFILGIVAFREANKLSEDEGREQKYLVAKGFLEEAQERAVTTERKPEWAYALGLSLHRIGRARAARPYLTLAVDSYPPGKIESSLLLSDTYLYSKTPEDLNRARALNASVVAMPELTDQQRDRAYLQQAQILYALDLPTEAEASLSKVKAATDGITILRAEVSMKAQKWQDALEMLRPVMERDGLQQIFPRQARYLMGVCEQRLADVEPQNRNAHLDAARNHYEQTFRLYHGSHEAIAARLWAADVLRKQDFHEKALETYNEALRQVRDPEDFSNKWIDVKVFREAVLIAWNAWNAAHLYQHSVSLSEHLVPLFSTADAAKYTALASQKSAEYLEQELQSAPYHVRKKRRAELERRWIRSGQAFLDLAIAQKTTAEYPDDLWTSAEHFTKGRDYLSAAKLWTKFIDTNPTTRLPTALVRKGTVLMQLKDFDDGLKFLQRVVNRHATDPVVFQARFLVGKCYYETNKLDLAERTWREMLVSNNLTPAAQEWQNALYELGLLLHRSAEQRATNATALKESDPETAKKLKHEAYQLWDQAIVRLEEFLDRYDVDDVQRNNRQDADSQELTRKLIEIRYSLAMATQRRAELPQEKRMAAETDNARKQYFQQMKQLLDQSNSILERLKAELRQLNDREQIDQLGLERLRNCHFEIPDNYFALEDYNSALGRYREAAGLYQGHPDALRAMVQEANCYDLLGRSLDARGALAQAKFILEQIPDEEFLKSGEALSKEEWRSWIDWAIKFHHENDSALTPNG